MQTEDTASLAPMRRSCWIAIVVLLGTPIAARADCLDVRALRGPVASVVVSVGYVHTETGATHVKMARQQEWIYGPGKRTIEMSHFDAPVRFVPFLFAITSCEFDDAGRLLRTRWKRHLLAFGTTQERVYDQQGRLARVIADFGPDRLVTYTYSGNAQTTHHPAHSPVTTTTERDSSGRIVKETQQRLGEKTNSVVEYRYGPGTQEIIGVPHHSKFHYRNTLDHMGNVVSSTDVLTGEVTTTQFDYDSHGNWTKRVRPIPGGFSRVDVRVITYSP